jgi:hypothetical protein
MNLLIVEDDDKQIEVYIDTINQHNKNSQIKITHTVKKTFEDAHNLLKSNYYDGAIIDLRLSSKTLDYEGVKLVEEINGKLRIPVYVVSASLGEVATTVENVLLQKRNRTDSFKTIIDELLDIYNSGITKLLKPNSFVDEILTKIFWNHLPIILNEYIKEKKTKPQFDTEKTLVRYISAYINEYLELNSENNLEAFHNTEFYIKPCIKSNYFTGDIIKNKKDNSLWVILTPACDLATDSKRPNPKAEAITLALIQKNEQVLTDSNKGNHQKLMSNSADLKFHNLPKSIIFEGGFVNFQYVQSVIIAQCKSDFEPLMTISNSFRKDIISRFSNYYSRQGQPVIE